MSFKFCRAIFCNNSNCLSFVCGGEGCTGSPLDFHNFKSFDSVLRCVKSSFDGCFVGDCVFLCYDENGFLYEEYYVTFPGAVVRGKRCY